MPEASRHRPEGSTVLGTFSAQVRARPNVVFDALAGHLHPGPEAHSFFTADPISSFVIVQGGWWYRAEYRVVAGMSGSIIEHTLLNVAARMHWAGPIAGRREVREAPAVFQRLVQTLREELE
jgi:hypothetical protein